MVQPSIAPRVSSVLEWPTIMTELLGKLFGSIERVKIMRLFLMNPTVAFTKAAIARRSKVSGTTLSRELIKSRLSVTAEEGGTRAKGWQLDLGFPLLAPLKSLLFPTEPFTHEEIVRKFKNGGRIKLIIAAGIFIQDENSRADLLIVGDNLKKRVLDHALKSMEAEIGRELVYGIFETEDFKYRLGVYDKFIRDLLDYPHEVMLDKIGATQA